MKFLAIGMLCASMLAVTDAASAAERGGLEITPSLGRSRLIIDADQVVTGTEEDIRAVAGGVTLDYTLPIGLTFEVGTMRQYAYNELEAFDSFRLATEHLAVGWAFETPFGLRIIPKLGYAYWKLSSREGRFFNPGPEARKDVEGDAYFWELTLSQKITRRFSLGASYRDPNYGFGEARSLSVVATFGLFSPYSQ